MILQSKIRHIFSDEVLSLAASICDTKRIDSSQEKMKLIADLLYTYDIKFGLLGGATNRFVLFIEGYAIKFALDSQGYRDNMIEYSICEELQPYVTKAYETNGYILVAECVRNMTESDFIARKQDMLNILMTLADDYLLGDVGYIKKNFTNWGIRDNGELVILDYAYCHRATESLFTCSVCGEGILVYDHVFEKLSCTNKSVCHATFTYDDKKTEQGDQVDLDMIEERKRSSLVLKQGTDYVEIDDTDKGRLITKSGKKIIVVDDDITYQEMMEVRDKMLMINYDKAAGLDKLIERAMTASVSEVAKGTDTLVPDENGVVVSTDTADYVIDPEYQSERIGRMEDTKQEIQEDDEDSSNKYSLESLLRKMSAMRAEQMNSSEDDDEQLGIILDGVPM